ncbi:MAG: FAD-binding oxidoreductase [Bacteroidales bacterium]|nr:FAD-binding oxidoreductase [Bacteroidales bacterium]
MSPILAKYREFLQGIKGKIPQDRIYTDSLKRFCWGTDAGCYRMVPKIVIRSDTEEEIALILKEARSLRLPVTFRAAGTSLSGQAISDSILVVAGKNWESYSIEDDGKVISLQPGLIGDEVNRILAPYSRKFGPDPASIKSAMVGGIVANNSSGMSCGVKANADRTLVSARIVLSDGTVLDTGDEASRKRFQATHTKFISEIKSLRDRILSNAELTEKILHKYSIKNVTGLNLLPFVEYSDPFDIIAHLMVGSEGTLAFISGVRMKTLPLEPFQASAMIYFKTIQQAASAVVAMEKLDVCAAEMLDRRSLASVNDTTGKDLAAVLTQVRASSQEELDARINAVTQALEGFETKTGVNFSRDPEVCARYWAARSGIFPSVGGMRREGTTCIIEDVAFHIEDLPLAAADLSELLDAHGYDDSCIYGHALDGNFHFIINQAFDSAAEVARYEKMIRDLAAMVVGKYNGSLKAEHGTGRNMAPFVEYEWGTDAFRAMKKVKEIFDPDNLLNPGVIFNDDPDCFLKNFKALPVLSPAQGADARMKEAFRHLNKCIECGFCEVNCVSCGFTLSSRMRVAARREIARLEKSGGNPSLLKSLKRQYRYPGEETCAGDGMCSMSCPMGINVADLTHDLRRAQNGPGTVTYKVWNLAAHHFHGTKNALRGALTLAGIGRTVIGDRAMTAVCRTMHKAVKLPLWVPATPLPYRAPKTSGTPASDLKVVYFPSCFNQMMGKGKHSPCRRPLVEETIELLEKAGYEVIFPENKDSLCCGTVWESKGMPDTAKEKILELEQALWQASEYGKYPVLCDQSPCLHRMRLNIKSMHLYEPAEFIWKFLRDRLEFTRTEEKVAVHQTCTMRLMGLGGILVDLARLCASEVVVPEGVGCCGFAGDKGMTHPELNSWALRKLRDQVRDVKVGYSNSRTCEIGLETNSGIPYISIVYLVNACTKAK